MSQSWKSRMASISPRDAQRAVCWSAATLVIKRVGTASWTVHQIIMTSRKTGVMYVMTNLKKVGIRMLAPSWISFHMASGPMTQTKRIVSTSARTTRPKVPAQ